MEDFWKLWGFQATRGSQKRSSFCVGRFFWPESPNYKPSAGTFGSSVPAERADLGHLVMVAS